MLEPLLSVVSLAQSAFYHRHDLQWAEIDYYLQVRQVHIDTLNNLREDLRDLYEMDGRRIDTNLIVSTVMLTIGFGFAVEGTFPPDGPATKDQRPTRVAYAFVAALSLICPFWSLLCLLEVRRRIDFFMNKFTHRFYEMLERRITDFIESTAAASEIRTNVHRYTQDLPGSSLWPQEAAPGAETVAQYQHRDPGAETRPLDGLDDELPQSSDSTATGWVRSAVASLRRGVPTLLRACPHRNGTACEVERRPPEHLAAANMSAGALLSSTWRGTCEEDGTCEPSKHVHPSELMFRVDSDEGFRRTTSSFSEASGGAQPGIPRRQQSTQRLTSHQQRFVNPIHLNDMQIVLELHNDYKKWWKRWCSKIMQLSDIFHWGGLFANVLCVALLVGMYFQANYVDTPDMWKWYTYAVLLALVISIPAALCACICGPDSAGQIARPRLPRTESFTGVPEWMAGDSSLPDFLRGWFWGFRGSRPRNLQPAYTEPLLAADQRPSIV